MPSIAIMFDFDGTLFDTMGKYADLASDVMAKHLGLERKEARRIFLANAGQPFPKLLEKVFANFPEPKIASCANEYAGRTIKDVYADAKPFKDVMPALHALKSKGFELFVSSSTRSKIIEPLLRKHGLKGYFSGVYGLEQGLKARHVYIVRGQQRHSIISFVGDSKTDAALKREVFASNFFTVGRAGKRKNGLHKKKVLLKSGATFLTSDLRSLATVDFEKALGKASRGKRYRRTIPRLIQHVKLRLKRR